MAYKYEELTIWTHATLSAFLRKQDFGLPVVMKTQAEEKDTPNAENVQVLIDGPDFSRRGTRNERLATVFVKLYVNTAYKPTDVYHHVRVKARIIEAVSQDIPLKRFATQNFDGMIVGKLRPLPTESITVTTVSVDEPDGSLVEVAYCLEIC
jgi:hypothetical protein